MTSVMGPLPGKAKRCPLDVQIEQETDCGSYVRCSLNYAAEPGSRVPAYLLIPKAALSARKKFPALLAPHPTRWNTVTALSRRNCVPTTAPTSATSPSAATWCSRPAYPILAGYQPDLKALATRAAP